MITEDYTSFETAKLLKEKGFNERVTSYFTDEGLEGYMFGISRKSNSELEECFYSRPTLQMAIKWLREVHSIDISIDIRFWIDDEGVDVKSWRYTVYHKDEIEDFGQSNTYEEACEEAIKYCLENLI